jgi:hypothetical protein
MCWQVQRYTGMVSLSPGSVYIGTGTTPFTELYYRRLASREPRTTAVLRVPNSSTKYCILLSTDDVVGDEIHRSTVVGKR